jgi:hypothetical protein
MRNLLDKLIVGLLILVTTANCLAQEILEVFPDTLAVTVQAAQNPRIYSDTTVKVYFASPAHKVCYELQGGNVISGLEADDVQGILQNSMNVDYASTDNIPSTGFLFRQEVFEKSSYVNTQNYFSAVAYFLRGALGAAFGLPAGPAIGDVVDDARHEESCVPLVQEALASSTALRSNNERVPLAVLLEHFKKIYSAGLCVKEEVAPSLKSVYYTVADRGVWPEVFVGVEQEPVVLGVYQEQAPAERLVSHLVENGLVYMSIWEAVSNIVQYGKDQGLFDSIRDSVPFNLRITMNSKAFDSGEAEEPGFDFDFNEVVDQVLAEEGLI